VLLSTIFGYDHDETGIIHGKFSLKTLEVRLLADCYGKIHLAKNK
jgi:hypothetical protein